MRREKKSAAVSRLSPGAALALPSTHRRPFAPRQRGSRFQPWGLKRPKGRHRPARLCPAHPRLPRTCAPAGRGLPGVGWAPAITIRGLRHSGAPGLRVGLEGRLAAFLELLIPGVRSFSGLSAAGAHQHAATSGEPGPAPCRAASPGAGRAAGARSRSCPYLRAGGARRGGRAGSHWPRRGEWWPPRWPWPGPCPRPWPWPSLRVGRVMPQHRPSSPGELRTTSAVPLCSRRRAATGCNPQSGCSATAQPLAECWNKPVTSGSLSCHILHPGWQWGWRSPSGAASLPAAVLPAALILSTPRAGHPQHPRPWSEQWG